LTGGPRVVSYRAMLTFEEARQRVLERVRRTGTERVSLRHAAGRVLAAPLLADTELPPFDYSAMDGYAVATGDLAGGGPWVLPVVGESRAGAFASPHTAGTACRILTGGKVPPGADAVIMQEHVTRAEGTIAFNARPKPWTNIRRAGEDLRPGNVAIPVGTRLGPGALALAAMLNRPELTVARAPAVAIVCTGDELRPVGSRPDGARIPESNSAPLAALAEQAAARVHVAPIAADTLEATKGAIEEALRTTDLLLTVGGVSVGDHDVVRPSLEQAGVTLDFWKVAIKPGKPLAMGTASGAHVLGLPGNPASALVTFALFGMPLLRAMQGDDRPCAPPIRARLAAPSKRSPDRLEFARTALRVVDGELAAVLHGNQASGAATSLAASDGLALLPPGEGPLEAGTWVDVLRWGDV
jgi:molybdopterin molybdotransferase